MLIDKQSGHSFSPTTF